jgi:hypothetical protein
MKPQIDLTCPHCECAIGLDPEEPCAIWDDYNIPDGEFGYDCQNCGKTVMVVCSWVPKVWVEECEEF